MKLFRPQLAKENQTMAQTSSDSTGQQSGALLEDWPSSASLTCREEEKRSSSKKVSFSPYSQLHVYQRDDEAERKKSFTSSERKGFQAQAVKDSFMIRSLIDTCPYEGGTAILYLMDQKLLHTEELLGIENLIMGAEKTVKQCRKHTALVIKAQRQLEAKNDANIDTKLSHVATTRSLKDVSTARLRATLAA
jgi:hypothetical protein